MIVLGIEFVQDPKYPNMYYNKDRMLSLHAPCEEGEPWIMGSLDVEASGSSPVAAARAWAEEMLSISNRMREEIPEGW